MMDSRQERRYELVLLGATGFTGKLCAEHITSNLPTNLKWAVAGRSASKLSAVVAALKSLNSDRSPPDIEVCTLNAEDLAPLVRKTRILINTVGPYFRHSSPVVEACAKEGTHYLDVTGETPWVLEMIKKHHETAKANNAIIIPEIGLESAPSDLLAWLLVKIIKERFSAGTKEVIASNHDIKGEPSGGTLATVLGILGHYSNKEVRESMAPWALSPIRGPNPQNPISIFTKLFGVRYVPDLGLLTTTLTGPPNEAIVQRTWGLLDGGKQYGPKFTFHEYQRASNQLLGIIVHFAIQLGMMSLLISPLRWLLMRLVTSPGDGPAKEKREKELLEYRAIGTADQNVPKPKRAYARFRWDGGIYDLTGVFLAEAAMAILQDTDLERKLGGGVLTPAMLGQPFVDRLKNVGCTFETEIMPDH